MKSTKKCVHAKIHTKQDGIHTFPRSEQKLFLFLQQQTIIDLILCQSYTTLVSLVVIKVGNWKLDQIQCCS